MKKTLVFAISLAAAISASASIIYSSTALSGLVYVGNPGDAQYVPTSGSTPALAQLYTPDSGLSATADSPAVFVQGPITGTLSSFVASYSLYGAATGPSGTSPYWILWMTDDTGYNYPIVADGGSTLNGASSVHVGDLINGSITLSTLCGTIDPISEQLFGGETVAWAGVEIGDWDNGGLTIPASANIQSITIGAVPEPTTMISGAMLLLPFGASTLRVLRKSRTA